MRNKQYQKDKKLFLDQKSYLYQLEIDGFVIHENYIKYSKVNIKEEQKAAYEKLELICREIDKMEETGLNVDKWYSLEGILIKLGIDYTKI